MLAVLSNKGPRLGLLSGFCASLFVWLSISLSPSCAAAQSVVSSFFPADLISTDRAPQPVDGFFRADLVKGDMFNQGLFASHSSGMRHRAFFKTRRVDSGYVVPDVAAKPTVKEQIKESEASFSIGRRVPQNEWDVGDAPSFCQGNSACDSKSGSR